MILPELALELKRTRRGTIKMIGQAEQRLSGRIALVTGSTSGIGREIAVRFAAEGADIVVNGTNEKKAEETKQMIEKLGRKAIVVLADVSKSDQVEEVAKEVYEKFGRIDILVNNAGVGGTIITLLNLSEAEQDRVIAINLKGPWLVSKATCKRMLNHQPMRGSSLQGKVINIGSMFARVAGKQTQAYSAGKAGVISLTQGLAKELDRRSL